MTATDFTPLASLAGGALIGVATILLMAAKGRIAGVSGFAVRLLPPYPDEGLAGRLAFIPGIAMAPVVIRMAGPAFTALPTGGMQALLFVAAMMAGLGIARWLTIRPAAPWPAASRRSATDRGGTA